MTDLAVWLGLLLLAVVGVAIARFNPVTIYSRTILIRLAVVAIVLTGAVLMLGFYGPPSLTLSGVFNPDGG
jgi:hypothetical protein